jgi:hypothetical protein
MAKQMNDSRYFTDEKRSLMNESAKGSIFNSGLKE